MGEARRTPFRVIIGIDFSDSCTHAIYEGVQLARVTSGIDLNFVHVLRAPSDLHDATLIDELSEHLGRAMIRLERYVRDALFVFGGGESFGCDVAFHLRIGPPERELHQVAVDIDADLIIVGADQTRGLKRLLVKSTTKQLVARAHVPVVVAHPKDFRGLPRSPSPEPARAGDDLTRSGLTSYTYVDFGAGSRDSHISGLL